MNHHTRSGIRDVWLGLDQSSDDAIMDGDTESVTYRILEDLVI